MREARCQLEKRNSEIEQIAKELHDLRNSLRTAEKEKFEELDKVCFKLVVEVFEREFFMFSPFLKNQHFHIPIGSERTDTFQRVPKNS